MTIKKLSFSLLLLFQFSLSVTALQLVEDGQTAFGVQLPAEPVALERLALQELLDYLKKSTGVEFAEKKAEKRIILQRDHQLADQESEIRLDGDHLILSGGDEWGVLYAVYAFLENQLGIRWFSAYGDELVPQHRSLTLDFKAYRQKPAFAKRGLIGSSYYKFPFSSMFFLRNRLNICNSLENPVYPGSKPLLKMRGHQSHTLFFYIPPEKDFYPPGLKFKEEKYYFAEHPEFYAMNSAGERVKNLQLCFGNVALREEFTRRFLECAELLGTDGIYAITAMDWPGTFCYCPACRKLAEQYQCSAGPLLDYLIELCGIVADKHPGIYLSTLAYRKDQSEKPPQLNGGRLPDNMIIVFAPIDDDFSKTFEHANNAETYRHIQEWGRLTDNLWVWYYPLAYGGGAFPFGGIRRSAMDTRLLCEGGATGSYYEHDVGVFSGLNFGDLMTWMFLKLFQDPTADYQALVQEFCSFYYGAAAADMVQYIQELDQATMAAEHFLNWNAGTPKTVFSTENLLRWTAAFDRMEASTKDDSACLIRVREARMGLDVAVLQYDFQESVRREPTLFPPVSEIEKRVLATLDQSLNRRVPDGPHQYLRDGNWKKSVQTSLENSVIVASVTPKPLGAPLDQVDPARVRQVFAKQVNKCGFAKLEDAAVGQAIYDQKAQVELPFSCGVYDFTGKKHLLDRKIIADEIVPDRFHLYRLGDAPIPSSCYVWTMRSWIAGIRIDSLYTAGEALDKKYDIWLSLKFEGKGYHPESTAAENRVWIDRVVVVEN